jgi:hypothetical protein
MALPLILGACEVTPEPTPVATSIVVAPTAVALTAIGAAQQLSAVVRDQNGDTLPSAGVAWTTSNAALVAVNATGLATAVANGSAQVTATSGSLTASVAVSVAQTPAQLVKVSGDSQSAGLAQALAQPIVVRVNDATGHAIAGVGVTFAATVGSGSVGTMSATTSVMGAAQTTWTLGPGAGSQSATATVAGSAISGNPALFTATSLGPPVLTLVVSGLNVAILATGLYALVWIGWLPRRVALSLIIGVV